MSSGLNPFLDPTDALELPEWYVSTDGNDCVGPVSARQIARGILAGKVPTDAQVVRGGDFDWEEVTSHDAVVTALKTL